MTPEIGRSNGSWLGAAEKQPAGPRWPLLFASSREQPLGMSSQGSLEALRIRLINTGNDIEVFPKLCWNYY